MIRGIQTLLAWLEGMVSGAGKDSIMNELRQTDEFEAVLEASKTEPQLIFKHSTTCPISAGAHSRLSAYLKSGASVPPCHLVKVIESRPLSNAIAQKLGVQHQSPQIILLKNGEAIWDTSHGAITGDAISAAIAKA